jgi:hypothetical protein
VATPAAAAALLLVPLVSSRADAPGGACSPSTWSENRYVTKLSRTQLDMVPHVGSGLSDARAKCAQAKMPCCSAASAPSLLLPPPSAAARSLQPAMAATLPLQVHLMAQCVSQGVLGSTLNRDLNSSRLKVLTCRWHAGQSSLA